MSYYVYSTASNSTAFAIYRPMPADSKATPVIDKKILIRGGANVAPFPEGGIITPRGVVTEVSDSDMALLKEDYHFKEQVKNGFLYVEQKEVPVEKAIKNMKAKDASAPKTPADYEVSDKSEPDAPPIYKEKDSKRK